MLNDETWRKICERKQPYSRAQSIGSLVGREHERLLRTVEGGLREIREALDGAVGEEFARHCRCVAFERGRLTVGVSSPVFLDVCRRRFLFAVRQRLDEAVPHLRVADIEWTVIRDS